ncbi:hypothetical protein [Niabella hibiscisoli]|uniref:hypothetical protein n=1 Tax=Niabella hibiscisoli TaxID=1825928 RepID=UPI001F0DB214|nr:hypothetical protein [Niabella hibiscisoli]MCH5717194.1 hypothetical protein [Niabella hibiscisoli]
MHTSFVKIIHFSRLVKISGRLREFNYKKNNNAGDYVFDVDTADDRGNRIFSGLAKMTMTGQYLLNRRFLNGSGNICNNW